MTPASADLRAARYERTAHLPDERLLSWAKFTGRDEAIPEDASARDLRAWLQGKAAGLRAYAESTRAEYARDAARARDEARAKAQAEAEIRNTACAWGHCGHVGCDPDARYGGQDW